MKNFEGKIVLQKKVHRRICEEYHFPGLTPSFLCHFLLYFLSIPSLSSTPILGKKNNFASRNGEELTLPLAPTPSVCDPIFVRAFLQKLLI